MDSDNLTLKEAYLAMIELTVELYERTNSDEIGSLLGDLSLLPDGSTADPAAWGDWLRCVDKARGRGVDADIAITPPNRLK